MMNNIKTTLLSIFILFTLSLTAQMAPDIAPDDNCGGIENNAFQGGEKLVYKLYYNWKFVWIPAGEVKFNVIENEDNFEVHVTGKTYQSYNSFFEVDDKFYSKMDKETLLPTDFLRDIKEGKYIKYDSISFDQNNYNANTYHGRTKESAEIENWDLGECMQDMVSILYHVRNFDFESKKKGHKFPVKIFFDKEIFDLDVEYRGVKKKKKIKDLGKFDTYEFSPEVVAGEVFDEDTRMKIWVSKDGNKIPLQIESPVSIGSVKAVLKSYEGLKHPLEKR